MTASVTLQLSGWLSGVTAGAGVDSTGRWTEASPSWGHQQIHLALLRGDGSHHSKILSWGYFRSDTAKLGASLWGWNPGSSASESDCTTYPGSRFTRLSLWLEGIPDLFCAGHATLGNGDLLVTGGQDGPGGGLRQSIVFRPNPAGADSQWSRQGEMDLERWYPSNVGLPDGRQLVFGGARFQQMLGFGGTEAPQDSASATRRDVERLGLSAPGRWLSRIGYDGTLDWPEQREGHSAVWFRKVEQMVIFGGRGGVNHTTKYNDLFRLRPNLRYWGVLDDRYEYVWKRIILSQTSELPPSPRDRHSAVMLNDTAMILYGGRDNQLGPRSDVRRLDVQIVAVTPPETTWAWTSITAGGTGPGPRYGHAAVHDPGNNRMLVFGGRDNSGLANNEVYALSFSGTPTWSPVGLSGPAQPAAREGHTWVMDPTLRDSPLDSDTQANDRRFLLFGGKTSAGPQKDLWALWVHGSGAAAGTVQWEQLPSGPAGMAAVSRHAALWDGIGGPAHDRMLVWGGETAGGASSAVWEFHGTTLTWSQRPSHPLLALAGHTAVFSPKGLDALKPEEFVPNPAGPGSWQVPGQPPDTAQWVWSYPHAFLLPSGNVFYSGPDRHSLLYRRTQATPSWQALGGQSADFGGSAVQYRPGEILKCGSAPDSSFTPSGTTEKIAIDGGDATGGWVSVGSMTPRVYPDLTVLPDGKVLVSGGLVDGDDHYPAPYDPPVREPQLWDPATGAWSGPAVLAPDPARRGYHSVATLLPDGRVLTAGGENSESNPHYQKATIFCPPYLFNKDGSLASRPTIWAWHDTLGYGQTFLIWTEVPDSILSVSLIRPGAVTHGFSQDQRYVPLPFQVVQEPGYCAQIVAQSPGNANLAPPGDYLLFLMQRNPLDPGGSGVPSVAQWVRVRPGPNGPMIGYAPPGCAGGGCPMVDSHTAQGWELDNSILGRSLDGELAVDTYRLRRKPEAVEGRYRLRIRENEQEYTTLDEVRLWAVDHPPGLEAFATRQGVVLGERRAAYRVTTAAGEEVTPRLQGTGLPFHGRPGDTLWVELSAPVPSPGLGVQAAADGGDGPALLEEPCCEKQGAQLLGLGPGPLALSAVDQNVLGRTGILVQVPEEGGTWRTVHQRYPRERDDAVALEREGHERLRLVFTGRHRVGFVGRVVSRGRAREVELPLLGARHSRAGELLEALREPGGSRVGLEYGDTLSLEFAAPPVPQGQVRELFLVTRGFYTSDPVKGRAAASAGSAPPRFALAQNHPNPFGAVTTIRFALPQASRVRLEVFDLQGRRVRVLAEGRREAGEHAVPWDRRDRRGAVVAPGVYLYRLTAPGFREQRRMVLLPQ